MTSESSTTDQKKPHMEDLEDEDQDYIEQILDEADRLAAETDVRLTHEEVFESLRKKFGFK